MIIAVIQISYRNWAVLEALRFFLVILDEGSLRRAAAAKPTWFKPHWMLAQLLRLEGRVAEAAAEAAIAADLDGGKHPEVTRTAAELQAARR